MPTSSRRLPTVPRPKWAYMSSPRLPACGSSGSSHSPSASPGPSRRTSLPATDARSTLSYADGRPILPQRHSSNLSHEEALINSLEAEEERLVLSLSKKLEQVRSDNAHLQTTFEREQEALFNKLAQLKTAEHTSPAVPSSPTTRPNFSHLVAASDPLQPSESVVNQALQAENTYLRESLANLMRDRERSSTAVESYRSELIELRQRLGLDVSDLIGSPSDEPERRRMSNQGLRPVVPHNSFASMYHASNRRSSSSSFAVGSPPTFNSFGQASTPLTPSSPSHSMSPAMTSTALTTPGRAAQTIAEVVDHLRAETADGALTPPRHIFIGSPAAFIKAPPPSTVASGANSVSSSFSQNYSHENDAEDLDRRTGRSRSTSESRGSSAKVGETGQFRRARGASGASADRVAAQRAALATRPEGFERPLAESAIE